MACMQAMNPLWVPVIADNAGLRQGLAAARARRRAARGRSAAAGVHRAAAAATTLAADPAPPPSAAAAAEAAAAELLAAVQPSPVALARRTLQVGDQVLRLLTVVLRARSEPPDAAAAAKARALGRALAALGPVAVKLGQTLSMRPDLVGATYAAALSSLTDAAPPFPTAEAMAVLEAELGRPWPEVFGELSAEPVAAASVGQVYRGRLRTSGLDVAVKVQRPGVAEAIALDFAMARRLVGVAQKAAGVRRDLRPVIDEVGAALLGECDFRTEAANAAEFADAHARITPLVTVPRAMPGLATRRLLVSEWAEGATPAQLLAAAGSAAGGPGAAEATRQRILSMVSIGIQSALTQLLVTGRLHGDPHSGNLLMLRDGRLCFLDFGLLVRVPPADRAAMMAALVHLGLGEWRRLVDDLGRLGLLREGTDLERLAVDLGAEFEAVLCESAGGGDACAFGPPPLPLLSLQTADLSFSTLTSVIFRVAYRYRFILPPYFPLVVRAISSLEGVAVAADPGFKLVSAGMPVVLNQLLSDRRPEAAALLRELLLAEGGGVRTDDATQQILRVWLLAARQAERQGGGGVGGVRSGSAAAQAGGAAAATAAALDLTALLLDRRNLPLRRVLFEANPAATVAAMSPALRAQVAQLLVEALSSGGGGAAAGSLLFGRSAAMRAQRRRLGQLVCASVPKVLASPPAAIARLLAFTLTVLASVVAARARRAARAAAVGLARALARLGRALSGQGGGEDVRARTFTTYVPI